MDLTSEEKINGILHWLEQFITQKRKERMQEVLQHRSRYFTVVLEDAYQAHNASAVMRTCDCLGIQEIHFSEIKNLMKINDEVALGAEKWLDIRRWNAENGGNEACLNYLKEKKYLIVATSPHHHAFTPDTLPLDKPLAIIFGTEKEGLSEFWTRHADYLLKIPMYGFTESYNLSVSAAIVLYTLVQRNKNNALHYLSENEKKQILIRWLVQQIRDGESMLENYLKSRGWDAERHRLLNYT